MILQRGKIENYRKGFSYIEGGAINCEYAEEFLEEYTRENPDVRLLNWGKVQFIDKKINLVTNKISHNSFIENKIWINIYSKL